MTKYKITIRYDECNNDNPLMWYNDIKFACESRKYKLGNYSLNQLLDEYDYDGDYYNIHDIIQFMSQYGYVKPLSRYEHGFKSVFIGSPTDPWDSGYIGIVFVPNDVINQYSDIEQVIDSALDTYNEWLNGFVYCYTVEKYTSEGMELIDSSGGWYGLDTVESEARECISYVDDKDIEWDSL